MKKIWKNVVQKFCLADTRTEARKLNAILWFLSIGQCPEET